MDFWRHPRMSAKESLPFSLEVGLLLACSLCLLFGCFLPCRSLSICSPAYVCGVISAFAVVYTTPGKTYKANPLVQLNE
jgi:hypothetical protein